MMIWIERQKNFYEYYKLSTACSIPAISSITCLLYNAMFVLLYCLYCLQTSQRSFKGQRKRERAKSHLMNEFLLEADKKVELESQA